MTPASISEAADTFRHANARIRTMVKDDGRNGATTRAIAGYRRDAELAMRFILDSGERPVAGFLTAEASLIDNIAQSVTERPDLKRRLNTVRRDLRCRVEYLDDAAVGAMS